MAIIVGFIYLAFLTALLYAVLFVGDLGAPRTIDLGPAGPALQAWVIDGTLLALFALLHAALDARALVGAGWAERSGAFCPCAGVDRQHSSSPRFLSPGAHCRRSSGR